MTDSVELSKAIDSEKALLSACLNEPTCVHLVADMLTPEDFYPDKHQRIMQGICLLLSEGLSIDPITLLAKLGEMGLVGNNGLGAYVGQLMDWPAAMDIEYHVGLVRKAAIQRRAVFEANKLLQAVKQGQDPEEIEGLFQEAARVVCTEIGTANQYKSHWSKPVNLPERIEVEPAAISWLIEERLPVGRGGLITGIGGSSKTRLLYQLAVGAVLGQVAWDWKVEKTGRALLVLTEDTADEVHRTIHDVCCGLGLSHSERVKVFQGVIPFAKAGEDCILLERTSTGAMVETALFKSLERQIKDFGDVVLFGLDPALSITTGDEMNQGEQRALGRMVDSLAVRTNATGLLIAHATKASLTKDELDSHNSRGGGAITDAVRVEYSLRTMTTREAKMADIDDTEERKRHVQLVATKGNHLPPSAYVPVWMRRDETGTLSQADITLKTDSQGPGEKDLLALDFLKALSATSTPTLKQWRERCLEQGVVTARTDDAQTKAMQRIVKRLSRSKLIEPGIGKGIWLPRG